MEITLGNIITLALAVVSFVFGYATLHQRVKQLEHKINEIDTLRQDIRGISDTLQNLMGKLDIFIKYNVINTRRDSPSYLLRTAR